MSSLRRANENSSTPSTAAPNPSAARRAGHAKAVVLTNPLSDLCAASPDMPSLLMRLASALAANQQVHSADSDLKTLAGIGLGAASSTTADAHEPIYKTIYGPYFKCGHHHLHLYLLDGTRRYRTFATEQEALEFRRRNEGRILAKPITIAKAIDEYVETRTDLRASSRATLAFRLRALAEGQEAVQLHAFPAEVSWKRLVGTNAVDTLHGIRSAARAFFDWCVRCGYLKTNPLARVEIVGKKKRGKAQLRLDEARTFLEGALALANAEVRDRSGFRQQIGALGAATALLLGMRNSEVVGCQVRDLDDGGSTLWIAASKTEAGVRRVEVPELLRPPLLKLAGNRPGSEPLFTGLTRDGMRYWTKNMCEKLGLPIVTPHGLRGTHATASMRPHANPREVAAALGHASFRVTERHYARREAIADARQAAALAALLPTEGPTSDGVGG
jgi:integrase